MDVYVENVTRRIETKRLVLRPYVPADFEDLAKLIGDFDVSKMLTIVPHPYTLKDAQDFYNMRKDADIGVLWIIEVNGDLAGVVSIGSELGYWLGKPFWGQGIMTEAANAAVTAFFNDTDVEEIRSSHFVENKASQAVLRKLGFKDIGSHVHHSIARGADVPGRSMLLSRRDWQAQND